MDTQVGTCGNCGGRVMGVKGPLLLVGDPPPPRCEQCGATAKTPRDNVLPMNPPATPQPKWSTNP